MTQAEYTQNKENKCQYFNWATIELDKGILFPQPKAEFIDYILEFMM